MIRKPVIVAVVVVAATALRAGSAHAALKIVTTTEDMASIAREIAGDRAQVDAIARGYQDPHYVEPKPSLILKLHAADLLIVVGREMEIGWLPPLLTQARNQKIQPGSTGYLDASLSARVLEMPTGPITRAMGDVHPSGNPHYWLDPANGRRIGQSIQARLALLDPANAGLYAQGLAEFDRRLAEGEKRWKAQMAPFKGLKVVTYHRSWPNFAEAFGLDVVGYVEPKPGIPPSPTHTLELIQQMKAQNVRIILVEPYFDLKTPNSIARETGAKVVVMPPSVGGVKGTESYVQLFDYAILLLVSAIQETGAR